MNQTKKSKWFTFTAIVVALVIITLACALPGQDAAEESTPPAIEEPSAPGEAIPELPSPTATLPPQPTPTPQSLPPALVEVDPPLGVEFPLDGALTLYFNQPMDQASVEAALTGQPALSGSFNWLDDSSVVFEPDAPYFPDSNLNIELTTATRAANGLALLAPLNLDYITAGPLYVLQVLPKPGLTDVDPRSAVVASFNTPVVPLGADPASLPAGFSLDPEVSGRGEWVNTSTYIFYPEPAMFGRQTYTVLLNRDLQSTAGGPFSGLVDQQGLDRWSFTTASAELVTIEPGDGSTAVRLDATFKLTFNQPMDSASVQENFTVFGPEGAVLSGEFGWDEDFTTLVFTPTQLLERSSSYNLTLLGLAKARGGNTLGIDSVAQFQTAPRFAVTGTNPDQGGIKSQFGGVQVFFSTPIKTDDLESLISITPKLPNFSVWWDEYSSSLQVNGTFEPQTEYLLTFSPELSDPWGGSLSEAFVLRFSSPTLDPTLQMTYGNTSLFVTPQETSLSVQAANLDSVEITVGSLPFNDFVHSLGDDGYDFMRNYAPADAQTWETPLDLPGDRIYSANLPLSPDGSPLAPGLYYLRVTSPQLSWQPDPLMLAVANTHLTFKLSPTQALVWALDLRNDQPVANAAITIYTRDGTVLVSGQTDAQGIFQSDIPAQENIYNAYFALLGQPGDANFGVSLSSWDSGLQGWDFGLSTDYAGPSTRVYLYTDRPIYRPGQTVHFRAILREAYNGRYTIPNLGVLPIDVLNGNYEQAVSLELALSAFGTAHGEYHIPDSAQPGFYQLQTEFGGISFQVAEYRKPEIDLQISAVPDPAIKGQSVVASVEARYFFDAPAGKLPLTWNLYRAPDYFFLPGYQVGSLDLGWMGPPGLGTAQFGDLVSSGEGQTSPEGLLTIEFPTLPLDEINPSDDKPARYTLEVTAQDESGFPVSARVEVLVHPADFYIGIRPDSWVGSAGNEINFDVAVVDWDQQPAGSRSLSARFRKVVWVRTDTEQSFEYPSYEAQYTPISSADFSTSADGLARLAFTPPEPGTYELEISGGGARSQNLIWVGGGGQVIWPNPPNQHIQLAADRESYLPGDSAQIFIPNPFGAPVPTLLTVERGAISHTEVLTLDANGSSISLPLSAEDAPNVYVAVTLIGHVDGVPEFRQGYLNLTVEPVAQTLQVTLTSQPERSEPGGEISFSIRVTDNEENPVQAEFSLAVADLATLALADPNAPEMLPAFYAQQPLSVRTGLGLAVYTRRFVIVAGGMGGGGDEVSVAPLREDFPDTAYWNAEIVTDANGEATVTLTLPDNLTTWQVEARGLTADTRVGQAAIEVVSSNDLLIRPVTPRFLVVGDHLLMEGVVHNNTTDDLEVDARLQATGFELDDPNNATQRVSVPAGGRTRVEWWGTVDDVESVDLIFSASAGDLEDAARPVWGDLPVLRYAAPQTFGTAGVLDNEGVKLEIVSLPITFDPSGGDLRLELAPSLAAAMTAGLDALEYYPYEGTEQTLSRFLPNLELYRAIQELGLDAPDLKSRLDRTLDEGLQRLINTQNPDGGWNWWPSSPMPAPYDAFPNEGGLDEISPQTQSDLYITTYVLFGLSRARQAGVFVDDTVITAASDYLLATLPSLEMLSSLWQFDLMSFEYYALSQVGVNVGGNAASLYEVRERLSPWGQSLLALTLETISPGDSRVDELLSNLDASAIRTATGTHWEGKGAPINLETPNINTALVIYALAQRDPASATLPEAVRYLMSARGVDGAWSSTYETAWALMALTEVMKGTGELAGDFNFAANLNGTPILDGQASGDARLNPVRATVPISDLYPADPNALEIQHGNGSGRLYYSAHLNVLRPVEDVAPLDRGIAVERFYEASDGTAVGNLVTVRIAFTLKNGVNHLMVEDYFPAGAEILDTSLKTSQQGVVEYDYRDPFREGWGWWLFDHPQIFDDHIGWTVDFLPAGTYELTYILVLTHPGEYRVLPARAWQFYFPEMQGNSAGAIFEIRE